MDRVRLSGAAACLLAATWMSSVAGVASARETSVDAVAVPAGQIDAPRKVTTFVRLLPVDAEGRWMLVKLRGSGFWVTPGWYQDGSHTLDEGVALLVRRYGLRARTQRLSGVYSLVGDIDHSLSTRLYYVVNVENPGDAAADEAEEVRWLAPDDALALLTFPHLRTMMAPILHEPDALRGGTVRQFRTSDGFGGETLDPIRRLDGR